MEGYGRVSPGFEPTFEAHNYHGPAECKKRDSHSDIEEHHYIYRAQISCHEDILKIKGNSVPS
jgi:hypothetical protein